MINKCTFIGNLGKNPELKQTEAGHKVTSFSIACARRFKNKQTGETKEETEWVPIVAWDALAEMICKYAHKGSQVYIEGEFRTRSYEAEGSGEKRYVSEIWAKDFKMLGRKPEGAPLPSSPDGTSTAAQTAPAQASTQAPAVQGKAQAQQGTLDMGQDDAKDDLPF